MGKDVKARDKALIGLGELSQRTQTYQGPLDQQDRARLNSLAMDMLKLGGAPLELFEDYVRALRAAERVP